jgi:hypothetical protein
MAYSTRVNLNRAKLTQVQEAIADGLLHFGHEVALEAAARAPDATPYGVGLVDSWGAVAYVDGRKVGDISGDGKAVAKPRGVRVAKGLTMLVGFSMPARFQEFGTVNHGAQPFFTPAVMGMQGNAASIIAEVSAPAIARIP